MKQKSADWLERNQEDYQALLRAPLAHLAATAATELRALAPDYHFPQKGIGRIKRQSHRPGERGGGIYKDWITYSASRPRESRFETNPNLFFLINAEDKDDSVLAAGGLYMPSSKQTRAIREAIAQDSSPFEALFAEKDFAKRFPGGFSDESKATRPPRGFDPNHPKIEWLKLQAFFVWRSYSLKEFSSPAFAAMVTADFKQILRLNRLLENAIMGRPVRDRYAKKSANSRKKPQLLEHLDNFEAVARKMDF